MRRGEKAITLCRPVTVKRTTTANDGTEETMAATFFVYRPQWFVMAQTEGRPVAEPPTPTWDKHPALTALDIQEIAFDLLDGNTLGFARERLVASMEGRFFYKHRAFEWEREFRVAICLFSAEEHGVGVPELGINVPFDAMELIQAVYLGPGLNESECASVRKACLAAGIPPPILSTLRGRPRYV